MFGTWPLKRKKRHKQKQKPINPPSILPCIASWTGETIVQRTERTPGTPFAVSCRPAGCRHVVGLGCVVCRHRCPLPPACQCERHRMLPATFFPVIIESVHIPHPLNPPPPPPPTRTGELTRYLWNQLSLMVMGGPSLAVTWKNGSQHLFRSTASA
jgi:hypothetical protein